MTPNEEPPPTTLDWAEDAVYRGWRPFPVQYGGKRPAVGIGWGTATATEPSRATLKLWFDREPVNIGIAAKSSGLVFLDDDTGTADAMEKLCTAYGQEVPDTYRVRTCKGWHWYFHVPPGVEVRNGGKGSYLKDHFGFDVRGNSGGDQDLGGYVVGPGSMHETGVIYTPEDDEAEAAALPGWLLDLLLAQQDIDDNPAEPVTPSRPDTRRTFTADQAQDYVRKFAEAPLRSATEGGRNDALNTAALVVGHFVPTFWSEGDAAESLREVAEEIGLDSQEIGPTIRSGLRRGMSEPYAKVDNPFTSASGNSREDDPGADPFEIAVEAAVHRLKVDEAARRRIADEHNAARPRIADGLIDDLEIVPEPDMLLGSLIPEGGVGFIGGKSGSYKTFLATSWACCIATGRPWLGRPEFSVRRARKVLYVAAEGMRGAAARLRSWETANETSRRGLLTLYPRPVHLGDPSQLDELAAVIEERGYEFVVIDTYHRSAPTADENSTKDFGVIFEAAARLRDDYGCGVLFVDHTGHAGERLRGTSGKGDDADYVLISTYPGVDRSVSVQRELQVFKLKDEDSSDRWTIRLEPVEGHTMPVVQIGTAQIVNPFRSTGEWWHPENLPEVPPEVVQKIETAAAPVSGRGVDAARWVWRYLKAMDDEQGHTRAQIKQALASIDRSEKFTPAAVDKAIPLLDKSGLVGRDKTRIWLEP